MGGKANEHNGIIIEQVDTGTGTGTSAGTVKPTGTSSKSNSSTDTGTTTGTGGSGSSGSGTGTTSGTGTKEKVVSGLVTLTEQQKRDKRNERRRERYAQKKAEQGEQVKPRKVNKSKKQEQAPALSNTQINSLIISLSAVIASRPKCEHWLLSEQEVNSITTPLTAMLKESEVFNKIGEHSNQIALIVACVSVFLPRIIQTVAMIQEEKKNEQRVKQAIEERNKIKNHKPSGKNDGGHATNSTAGNQNNNINEFWFGDAIY